MQERPLVSDYCSSSKKGGPCNEWHSLSFIFLYGWWRLDVGGPPSTDVLCYFRPTLCFLSVHRSLQIHPYGCTSHTQRHAPTQAVTWRRLLSSAWCWCPEEDGSPRRRNRAVSWSITPVAPRPLAVPPAHPRDPRCYRVHLLTPPSTPHSHRIHRAQGGAGIDADWLIRAADVQHSGGWGWGDGYLCDAHIPFFPPPEFCAWCGLRRL